MDSAEDASRLNWRVRGLPNDCDEISASDVLKKYLLPAKSPITVSVHSLAFDVQSELNVATVTFDSTPFVLRTCQKYTFGAKRELQIDRDFLGITPLYHPNQHQKPHTADIFIISGLGSHAFGSFREKSGTFMWPRDELPRKLPEARVLIYGYDTHLEKSDSFQNVEALGNAFSNDVRGIETPPTVPIIFIGHSLGGIVIEQAIIQMKEANRKKTYEFLQQIYGILFLGVPNQGMDTSSLRDMVKGQPNDLLLHYLQKPSDFLRNQRRSFDQAFDFKDSEVICFYETQKSATAQLDKVSRTWKMDGKKAILVDEESARNGRSWETMPHHSQSMDCSHSDLVKFDQYDQKLNRITNLLKDFMENAPKVIQARTKARQVFELARQLNEEPLSSHYQERDDVTSQLKNTILEHWQSDQIVETPLKILLHGLGGSGKTQLCRRFIKDMVELGFTRLLWYDATGLNKTEDIPIYGNEIGLPAPTGRVDLKSFPPPDGKWLMVIDDVPEETHSLLQKLPSNGNGCIIINSRISKFAASKKIAVAGMEDQVAARLLLETVYEDPLDRAKEEATALAFVRDVGGLPLAIDVAASCVIKARKMDPTCTIANYHEEVMRAPRALLNESDRTHGTGERLSIDDILSKTYKVLKDNRDRGNKTAADAIEVLHLCSMLHPSSSPQLIFSRIDEESIKSFDLSVSQGTKSALHKALTELNEIAFLKALPSTNAAPVYQMHPVIWKWAQCQKDEDDHQDWWTIAVRVLAESIPEKRNTPSERQYAIEIVPHLHHLLKTESSGSIVDSNKLLDSSALSQSSKISIGRKFGDIFSMTAFLREALTLRQSIKEFCEQHLSTDRLLLMAVAYDVGVTQADLGEYEAAVEAFKRARSIASPIYKSHQDLKFLEKLIEIKTGLADAYRGLGNITQELKFRKEVHEDVEKAYGSRATDKVLKAKIRLYDSELRAGLLNLDYQQLSDHIKELEDLNETLDECKDPIFQIITVRAELARMYGVQRRFDEAYRLRETNVSDRERYNFPTVDLLEAKHDFASSLWDLERYKEATALRQTIVAEYELLLKDNQSMDENYSGYLAARFNLAQSDLILTHSNSADANPEKVASVLTIHQDILQRRLSKLKMHHPDTRQSMTAVAYALSVAGDHEKALEMRTKLVNYWNDEVKSDDQHSRREMVKAVNLLAMEYWQRKNFKAAFEVRQIAKMHAEISSDPWAQHSLEFEQVEDLGRMKRTAEAVQLCSDTLSVRSKLLGEQHPDTVASQLQLYRQMKAHDHSPDGMNRALAQLWKVLEVQIKALSHDSADVCDTVKMLQDKYDDYPDEKKSRQLQVLQRSWLIK